MEIILRLIILVIFLGAFIFGIMLLVGELQAPGCVSLSATILYISLFATVMSVMSGILE